jgi:hypothetical protein
VSTYRPSLDDVFLSVTDTDTAASAVTDTAAASAAHAEPKEMAR